MTMALVPAMRGREGFDFPYHCVLKSLCQHYETVLAVLLRSTLEKLRRYTTACGAA